MKTTLCIIDMQPYFVASEPILQQVLHQIRLDKRRKSDIILFEYYGCGPSYGQINILLKGYEKFTRIIKNDDDGSAKLSKVLKKKNIYTKRFRFCGVNTCYCVYSTMEGLSRIFNNSKFQCSANLVNCECDKNNAYNRLLCFINV